MIYEYECDAGHGFERALPLAEYDAPQVCDCGKPATKVITRPPAGFVQGECRYDSPIDGKPISSWAQRRDDLARNHCQEYDPLMRQDAQRFRDRQQADLERSFDSSIEESIEKLPSRKKELLERELASGADATITRSDA